MSNSNGFSKSHSTFAIFFFVYFGFLGLVSPYLSLYFDNIGFDAIQIAILMSMLQITRIIGPFAWGWLADYRQDRIGIMRITSIATTLIFTGIFFSNNFTVLMIWMFILNSVSSSLTPLGEAATLHLLSKENAFEAKYGRLRLWGSLGFMVTVLLGGYWFDKFGVATLPWLGLIALCFVTLLAWRLWEPPIEGHQIKRGQLRSALKQQGVVYFFSSTFWMIFAHASLYVFYSLYLEKLGYDKMVIGLFWMLGVGAEVIYFYFQKVAFAKYPAQKIISLTFIIGAIRFLVIAYLPYFWPLIFAQVLHAFTFAAHHSASIKYMQGWFKSGMQARGQALYTSVSYGLGGTVGGLCAGWVWEKFGPNHAFGMSALACLIGYWSIKRANKLHYIPE